MHVYDIAVEFYRKVQVREYEPVDAKVTLKAQLTEDDNFVEVTNELMGAARDAVIAGLQNKTGGQTTATTTTAASDGAASGGKGRGRPATKKTEAPPTGQGISTGEERVNPADSEIPDEAPAKTETKTETKKAPAPDSEIPDEAPAKTETKKEAKKEGGLTATELQQYVSKLLGEKKITAAQVKEEIGKFSVARMGDLNAEQLSSLKDTLDVLSM